MDGIGKQTRQRLIGIQEDEQRRKIFALPWLLEAIKQFDRIWLANVNALKVHNLS